MEEKSGQKESTGENAKKAEPLSSKRESEGGSDDWCKPEKGTGVCSWKPGQGEVEGEHQSSREEADKVETPAESFGSEWIPPSNNEQHNGDQKLEESSPKKEQPRVEARWNQCGDEG